MKSNDGDSVFLAIVTIAALPLMVILNGWILTFLWEWFVVPITNLPVLSIPQAIGLSLIIGYLTHHHSTSGDKDEETSIGGAVAKFILTPPLVLLFGFIVAQFI